MITKEQWNKYLKAVDGILNNPLLASSGMKVFLHGKRINKIVGEQLWSELYRNDEGKSSRVVYKHPDSFTDYTRPLDLYDNTKVELSASSLIKYRNK
jgi:hypothetical protein